MARAGFIERTLAGVLRKASHCISIILPTWNCNKANINTVTIDRFQWIRLQCYYADGNCYWIALPPPSLATLHFQNNPWKPHLGMFCVSRYACCISLFKKYGLLSKRGKKRSGRPLSVCCLYTKQRVLEACARSILLAKRSDSSVPSQHI